MRVFYYCMFSLMVWGILQALSAQPTWAEAFPNAQGNTEIQHSNDSLLNLEEAVHLFLERNFDLIAARFGIDRAEAARLIARVYPNPQYQFNQEGLSGGFKRESNNVQYHRVEQIIEGFGKRRYRTESAAAGIEVAQAEFQDVLRLLLYELKKTFYETLLAQSNLALAQANRKTFQGLVEITAFRHESGEIAEADLIRMQVEQLRFEDEVASAQLALMESQSRLGVLLGMDGWPEAMKVEGSLEQTPSGALGQDSTDLPLERLSERALAHRPDLQALRKQKQQAESELKLARAVRYPDLTWGVQSERIKGVDGGEDLNTFGVGLGFSLPLWNRNQGGIAQAQAGLDFGALRVRQQETLVLAEVRAAAEQLRMNRERVESVRSELLPKAEESRRIAQALFEEGEASLLQLLDAERALNDARLRSNRVLFDYQASRLLLERALGVELDLSEIVREHEP